jgi:hypothetical protein
LGVSFQPITDISDYRHPGKGRDLHGESKRCGEIPAFAGMTGWSIPN